MTTQQMLDERYGRTRTRGRRWGLWIGIALGIVAAVVVAWMTVASSASAVDADTTGFRLVDDRTVEVTFQFTSPPGRGVACAVEAQDAEHGTVGWKVVEFEASEAHGRAYRATLPVTAVAVTGFVNNCWVT
ncbi:hypothetical protein GCM10009775_34720 [Microbacterium aoyamense]|uniref:DUF4307 domain-containing protein n=1 Tax=Microbacterium aoyamense TaxID=344166 RepID=A0ABP5BBU3_9MICO|nr:DUF4307 domain-containing protein [Microbacterium aoyamense]